MYQYRQAIINQVYEGEKQYLETLSTIIDTYLTPLRKSLKTTSFNFLGIKKAPCTEKEIGWLFNNVEDIYKLHLGNLSMFSERYIYFLLLLLLSTYAVLCNSRII